MNSPLSNSAQLTSQRHDVLKAWIAASLWLIVIAIESTAALSAYNTSRILFPILHYLFGMDWAHFQDWHFYIRKGGHVVGYGILSILLFRAFRASLQSAAYASWKLSWAAFAILGTAVVASLDEWHQSYIPSRTGRWQDVVLDTCAGIASQILIFVWWKNSGNDVRGIGHNATEAGNTEDAAPPAPKMLRN